MAAVKHKKLDPVRVFDATARVIQLKRKSL